MQSIDLYLHHCISLHAFEHGFSSLWEGHAIIKFGEWLLNIIMCFTYRWISSHPWMVLYYAWFHHILKSVASAWAEQLRQGDIFPNLTKTQPVDDVEYWWWKCIQKKISFFISDWKKLILMLIDVWDGSICREAKGKWALSTCVRRYCWGNVRVPWESEYLPKEGDFVKKKNLANSQSKGHWIY